MKIDFYKIFQLNMMSYEESIVWFTFVALFKQDVDSWFQLNILYTHRYCLPLKILLANLTYSAIQYVRL